MSSPGDFHHLPVLREEVVQVFAGQPEGLLVDCTVGGGGHAEALLQATSCRVLGLDRDPAALAAAAARCRRFGARFTPVRARFGELPRVLAAQHAERGVRGVLADLGVSSHQLDTPERGFSFQRPGPVDMRMDPDARTSASALVNEATEDELGRVIRELGEERRWRRVARAIVQGRPWSDTLALAEAVASVVGRKPGRIHPATRTFQALRIATNDELGELQALLPAAVEALAPGGALAVISFHSLEDRIVKRFLAAEAGRTRPRDPYGNPVGGIRLDLQRPRTARPGDPNPRSRSARLRAAVRLP